MMEDGKEELKKNYWKNELMTITKDKNPEVVGIKNIINNNI